MATPTLGMYMSLRKSLFQLLTIYPISKVHGNNMGPTWGLSAPDGPHVGPMNLTIRAAIIHGMYMMMNWRLFTTYRAQWTRATPGPLFTKRTDVLPQDVMKSRSREIGCYNDRVTLIFDRHPDSAAAKGPDKFRGEWKSWNPNLAALRLHTRSCGKKTTRLMNRGPEW